MTALRNIAAIFGKEWRHYFGSPIAWVALFVWTMLFGVFFYFSFSFFLEQSMRIAQQGMEMGGGGMKISLNEYLIRPLFHNLAVVALFIAPMLTMRLFAEEKRQGTIELLATSPITDWQVVIGKFLAASGPLRAHDPGRARQRGPHLDLRDERRRSGSRSRPAPSACSCSARCFLAMGTFVSTLTRNQIVAGILSFCLFLGMWTLGWADDPTAGPVMKAVAYLGVTTHLEDLVKGVVDLKDVVFYLSVITFGLFLAHQSVQSQRWRA